MWRARNTAARCRALLQQRVSQDRAIEYVGRIARNSNNRLLDSGSIVPINYSFYAIAFKGVINSCQISL